MLRLSVTEDSIGALIENERMPIGQTTSADYQHESSSHVMIASKRSVHTRKVLAEDNTPTLPTNDPARQTTTIIGDTEQPRAVLEQLTVSRNQRSAFGPGLWRKRWLSANYVRKESISGRVQAFSNARSLQLTTDDPEKKSTESDQQREDEISITIEPAPWLRSLGITYGLSLRLLDSSLHGWKHTLNSFRSVPDDAPIFKFYRDRD